MESRGIKKVPLCPKLMKKKDSSYCNVCRTLYFKHKELQHIRGIKHHKEMRKVMSSGAVHRCQVCNTKAMDLKKYAQHISTFEHSEKLAALEDGDIFWEDDCTVNVSSVSKKEPNWEDGSEEFRDRRCSNEKKRKRNGDGITDMTSATKRRPLNADGEDKPEIGALVHVATQCFKPIRMEPPDEPVMVTSPLQYGWKIRNHS